VDVLVLKSVLASVMRRTRTIPSAEAVTRMGEGDDDDDENDVELVESEEDQARHLMYFECWSVEEMLFVFVLVLSLLEPLFREETN